MTSFLNFAQPAPSWYSGRLWLLRLGYYKLERKKDKSGDWIWIVDHTIQWGKEKCLLILGIRQSRLPAIELYIEHQDVEPIALIPVENSNGQIVHQQLMYAAKKTGVPRQIVADYASDIKSGIERFCQHNPQCCYTYDIKHKIATILKRELKDDNFWNEFKNMAAKTRQRLKQTQLAALVPPNQRSKARYLNLEELFQWAQHKLCYLDLQKNNLDGAFDPEQMEKELGWLRSYRKHLVQWRELFDVVKATEEYMKFVGIFDDCHIHLQKHLDFNLTTVRAKKVRRELLVFAKQQAGNAKKDERLLASSEVIESVFGKFKSIESNHSKSGFSSMLLSLAAAVSKTTNDTVRKALKAVPTKKVHEWFKDNIGQSLQSKKKEVTNQIKCAERKQDQFNLSLGG